MDPAPERPPPVADRGSARGDRGAGAGRLAAAVAAVALVPMAVALWPNIPMTVRTGESAPLVRPVAAPTSVGHLVVLPYPAALGGIQSSMAWQAVEGMTFSMVGGGGPGIAPSRAGPEARGFDVLARASVPLGPAPLPRRPTWRPSAGRWRAGG